MATLHRHAWLGDWLPWIFLVLAVWRLGIQLFGFMAGMRGLYLIFAILAALAISYQGYLGGKLVYDYGIGTALIQHRIVFARAAVRGYRTGYADSYGICAGRERDA